MAMGTNIERVKVLVKDIQESVSRKKVSYGRNQLVASLEAHAEALKLKRLIAVERASFGLAAPAITTQWVHEEFDLMMEKVGASLATLRQFTREFALKNILEPSHA